MPHTYLFADVDATTRIVTTAEVPTAVIRVENHPVGDIASLFEACFDALFPALERAGVRPVAPPFSLYRRVPTDTTDVEVGVPIDRPLDGPVDAGGVRIKPSTLPAGEVARMSYVGGFDGLGQAWGDFMGSIITRGRQASFPFWETYMTEPNVQPPRTDFYSLLA